MNHIVLIAAIGLLSTTTVFAQTASAPLIVVEDRGGDSALPYYRPLNPQPDQAAPPAPMPAPRTGNATEAEAARERVAAKEREVRHAAHLAFCEGLAKAGKLPPGLTPVLAAVIDALAEQTIEFGEGSDKKPLHKAFQEALSALPQVIVFGEVAADREVPASADFAAPAGYDVDPRGAAIHARALAYRRAHPDVDYLAAVKAVSR